MVLAKRRKKEIGYIKSKHTQEVAKHVNQIRLVFKNMRAKELPWLHCFTTRSIKEQRTHQESEHDKANCPHCPWIAYFRLQFVEDYGENQTADAAP